MCSSSSPSSSSDKGPKSLEGQGVEPRLIDTRLHSFVRAEAYLYALLHGGYDSAYECVSSTVTHMVKARSQEVFPLRGSIRGQGCKNVFNPYCSYVFCLFLFLLLTFLSSFFTTQQLFVFVVWNFELYMIPLALLLPLVWNYILIASGKDTRQDVVSNPITS